MFQVKLKTGGKSQQARTPFGRELLNATDVERCCATGEEINRAVLVVPILEKKFKIIVDCATSSTQKKGGGIGRGVDRTDSLVGLIGEDSFLNVPFSRIITICKATFHLDQSLMNESNFTQSTTKSQCHQDEIIKKSHWNGVRSLLICAPEGSGKTFLLDEIEQSLRVLRENSDMILDSELVILKLSAKNCGNQSSHPASVPSSSQHAESTDRNVVRSFLYRVVQSMAISRISPIIEEKIASEESLKIALLIDDLDILFLPFMRDDGEGDDEANVNDKDTASVRAAYLLRQLLSAIAVPGHGFDQIIVIGATRFSASNLPRSHSGACNLYFVYCLYKSV
jgi:hypothetical protein